MNSPTTDTTSGRNGRPAVAMAGGLLLPTALGLAYRSRRQQVV